MNIIQAMVLGVVQGITEWIPVSSSAHLAVVGRILQADADMSFYAFLHIATILSVIFYYKSKIRHFFIDGKSSHLLSRKGLYVVIAVIPAFIAGFFFHDMLAMVFTSFPLMGIALIVNAVILFSSKYFNPDGEITLPRSIAVGIAQMFSLVPGISRLGITVSAGLFSGIKKEENIMFSIMLSIPLMLGAFVYELIKVGFSFSINMTAAFIVSAVIGYFALHHMMKTVKRGEFYHYWLYCLILGIILLFN